MRPTHAQPRLPRPLRTSRRPPHPASLAALHASLPPAVTDAASQLFAAATGPHRDAAAAAVTAGGAYTLVKMASLVGSRGWADPVRWRGGLCTRCRGGRGRAGQARGGEFWFVFDALIFSPTPTPPPPRNSRAKWCTRWQGLDTHCAGRCSGELGAGGETVVCVCGVFCTHHHHHSRPPHTRSADPMARFYAAAVPALNMLR